jgi:hypothetical protein
MHDLLNDATSDSAARVSDWLLVAVVNIGARIEYVLGVKANKNAAGVPDKNVKCCPTL